MKLKCFDALTQFSRCLHLKFEKFLISMRGIIAFYIENRLLFHIKSQHSRLQELKLFLSLNVWCEISSSQTEGRLS